MKAIADAHSATPRHVALGFPVRRRSPFEIPKAVRSEHDAEKRRGGRPGGARIDPAFPHGPRPRELTTL